VRRLVAASALAGALASGCSSDSEPAATEHADRPAERAERTTTQSERARPQPRLRPARCPAGLGACRVATGLIIYVERVDPDGDGDAHFVLVSEDSVTEPGISVIDVRRDLRPQPLPGPGDRISAAGPVQIGSHGQRQIHALRLRVSR
jgi:hypothetical protein